MDYTSLINDFVDGRLDSSQEDNLFYMLSSSDDLRTELKQFIRLEKAFSTDAIGLSPSASSTIGVFNRLGIVAPALTPSNSPIGSAQPGFFSSFWGKYSQGFVSGIVSTVLTAVIVFILMSNFYNVSTNDGNSNKFANKSVVQNSPSSLISIDSNNIVPKISSQSWDNDNQLNKGYQKEKVIIKYKYIEKPTEKNEYADNLNPIDAITLDIPKEVSAIENSIMRNSLDINKIESPNITHFKTNKIISDINQPNYLDINTNNLGIFCEFKSSEYWSLPKEVIPQSSNPIFSNTSLTLLKSLSQNFLVGMDLRQEFFYQKYEGVEKDAPYEYLQNTNYISLGITGRYYLGNIYGIEPFSQLTLGGNKAGFIGRFMVGVNYKPLEFISLMLGVEGSVLRFHHHDQFFYSPKIGLNYGVSFNF